MIRPLFDRVVLSLIEKEDKVFGGIVLPSKSQEQPIVAQVVAVGPGGLIDGKDVKIVVKVGDKVVFSKFAGTECKLDGKNYIIVRQTDILAIID